MDAQALLRDRRFQVAAGVGVVGGAFVLFRNHSSSASAAGAASDAGTTTGQTPTFNDGGSDIAATLGNFSTELQGILQNYATTLKPAPIPPKTPKPIKPLPVGPTPKPIKKKPTRGAKLAKAIRHAPVRPKASSTQTALVQLGSISSTNLIHAGSPAQA